MCGKIAQKEFTMQDAKSEVLVDAVPVTQDSVEESSEEQSLSFEDLYDVKSDSDDDSVEEESKDEPEGEDLPVEDSADDEPEEGETPQKKHKPGKGGKGFKFDAEQYRKKGITDPKALEELENQERRVWERDVTIGKQGSELGDSRKQLKDIADRREELKSKKDLSDEEYNELHDEDPAKAKRRSDEANKAREEDKKLRAQEFSLRNKQFLSEKMPDFEDLVDDIADVIKLDLPEEVSDTAASQFRQDPYQLDSALSFNLADRVKKAQEINSLKGENDNLKGEVEKLKSELKDAPKNALNKVRQMTSNPHSLGVASGKSGTNTTEPSAYGSILMMSDDELISDLRKVS